MAHPSISATGSTAGSGVREKKDSPLYVPRRLAYQRRKTLFGLSTARKRQTKGLDSPKSRRAGCFTKRQKPLQPLLRRQHTGGPCKRFSPSSDTDTLSKELLIRHDPRPASTPIHSYYYLRASCKVLYRESTCQGYSMLTGVLVGLRIPSWEQRNDCNLEFSENRR